MIETYSVLHTHLPRDRLEGDNDMEVLEVPHQTIMIPADNQVIDSVVTAQQALKIQN